eukprot:1193918-Prorocentrum_minimum.AAC.9
MPHNVEGIVSPYELVHKKWRRPRGGSRLTPQEQTETLLTPLKEVGLPCRTRANAGVALYSSLYLH